MDFFTYGSVISGQTNFETHFWACIISNKGEFLNQLNVNER
jgi:hypothetical protein